MPGVFLWGEGLTTVILIKLYGYSRLSISSWVGLSGLSFQWFCPFYATCRIYGVELFIILHYAFNISKTVVTTPLKWYLLPLPPQPHPRSVWLKVFVVVFKFSLLIASKNQLLVSFIFSLVFLGFLLLLLFVF